MRSKKTDSRPHQQHVASSSNTNGAKRQRPTTPPQGLTLSSSPPAKRQRTAVGRPLFQISKRSSSSGVHRGLLEYRQRVAKKTLDQQIVRRKYAKILRQQEKGMNEVVVDDDDKDTTHDKKKKKNKNKKERLNEGQQQHQHQHQEDVGATVTTMDRDDEDAAAISHSSNHVKSKSPPKSHPRTTKQPAQPAPAADKLHPKPLSVPTTLEERAKGMEQKRKERQLRTRRLQQRTKKGQPVMKHVVHDLLHRIVQQTIKQQSVPSLH
jgi:hypothetical protein